METVGYFLWRCRGCAEQYTVRIGTVYEESRLPLRYWAYAFWRASTSKKGVSAFEIKRQCQISYKSALFLLNRIRCAMDNNPTDGGKFNGTIEVDETYVGGKSKNMRQCPNLLGMVLAILKFEKCDLTQTH